MSGDERSIEALQDALGSEFEVLRQLGRGTTSTVYEARELALGRSVAIKVLHPFLAEDEAALKRFEEEARAVAALSHPHVARVYRLGRLADGTPYLVMRLVKGGTLEDRLKSEGNLLPELAIPLLKDVVSGLSAAHAIGIVHRDLRPANVLWDQENDTALLVDFGISALFTPAGPEPVVPDQTVYTGDPQYMSPEQIRNDEVSVFADIYGFGVMAYKLLTGEGPYDARTGSQLIEAHLKEEPKDLAAVPDVQRGLADVFRRCLNKEPKHRPAAADVSRSLTGVWQVPSDDAGSPFSRLTGNKLAVQVIAAGFVASGSLAGGVATLTEQYDFMPAWAFTESLVTGGAIVLACVVIAWFQGVEGRRKVPRSESTALTVIFAAWLVASLVIV